MAALVIKKLPNALHGRLKARAKRHHRSLTKEAVALLELGVKAPPAGSNPAEALVRLLAAGDALERKGVDLETWAARSREVWR